MEWTDAEIDLFATLAFDSVHPITIAKVMRKPVKEVHDKWRRLMEDMEDEDVPAFVRESRQRKRNRRILREWNVRVA